MLEQQLLTTVLQTCVLLKAQPALLHTASLDNMQIASRDSCACAATAFEYCISAQLLHVSTSAVCISNAAACECKLHQHAQSLAHKQHVMCKQHLLLHLQHVAFTQVCYCQVNHRCLGHHMTNHRGSEHSNCAL